MVKPYSGKGFRGFVTLLPLGRQKYISAVWLAKVRIGRLTRFYQQNYFGFRSKKGNKVTRYQKTQQRRGKIMLPPCYFL